MGMKFSRTDIALGIELGFTMDFGLPTLNDTNKQSWMRDLAAEVPDVNSDLEQFENA